MGPGHSWQHRTIHLLIKPDILTCYQHGRYGYGRLLLSVSLTSPSAARGTAGLDEPELQFLLDCIDSIQANANLVADRILPLAPFADDLARIFVIGEPVAGDR